MRKVSKEFTLYKYAELNPEAKQKVKETYQQRQEPIYFREDCECYLDEQFPESRLKVQFSLGYSQGDGLNIYGTLDLRDILPKLDGYTPKEIARLNHYLKVASCDYLMDQNHRYEYSICRRHDYTSTVLDDLERSDYRNIDEKLLNKFEHDIQVYMEAECGKLEKWGYDFFYEQDDALLDEWAEGNEYEFLENGEIWNG